MNHATAHGELKPVQSMFFALTNDCSPKTYTKGQNALAPIYQEVMPREHVDIWGLAGEESRKRERNIKYFLKMIFNMRFLVFLFGSVKKYFR